nr:HD domain-containing protein [Desulfobacterales bacterium]
MKRMADLLFEARMLKETPRSGFQFLGAGRESVAEHVYSATFIAYVMTQLVPGVDALKLISLCLVHDLPEARIGDLNSVNKNYVQADE